MDDLLKLEKEYTEKLIKEPSELNKENLINIKIKIIELYYQSEDDNIKKVCNGYYDDRKIILYKQYEYFSNLHEYLKNKEDTSNITKIINSIIHEICL